MKTCPHCSAPFESANSRKVYCGKRCKDRAKSAEFRLRHQDVICSIDGCETKSQGLKHCAMHTRRIRLTGDPGPAHNTRPRRMGIAPCSVEGCDRTYNSNGLCTLHYGRLRTTGSTGGAELRRKPVGPDTVWRWEDPDKGYVYLTFPGSRTRQVLEHRHVMSQHIGRELTSDENVHHINGDRADNRIENLELWSKSQPAGQRVADKLAWAHELIALYGDLPELQPTT